MKDDLATLPLNDRGEPVDWAHALAIIERLTRELAEALSHEGAEDARIEQLLEYLHFDGTSHRDWVADCQTLEAERDRLRALLERWLETEQRWSFLGNETREALAGSPSN